VWRIPAIPVFEAMGDWILLLMAALHRKVVHHVAASLQYNHGVVFLRLGKFLVRKKLLFNLLIVCAARSPLEFEVIATRSFIKDWLRLLDLITRQKFVDLRR
jgi:hypothetical protein